MINTSKYFSLSLFYRKPTGNASITFEIVYFLTNFGELLKIGAGIPPSLFIFYKKERPYMTQHHAAFTEGSLREQMAAYFLSLPPTAEQTPAQRQEFIQRLEQLGQLERREILDAPAAARPLVWGNPATLLQAFLSAAQRLAAGLGQPLLLFPAKDAAIGHNTLLHPRILTVTMAAVLADACRVTPRQPVWVRLQEQRGALAVSVTASAAFADAETLAILKECTRLHSGSLVHCDNSVLFTCGQSGSPPPGVRLYGCPQEEDLLQDTLSPVWSGFYARLYTSSPSSSSTSSSNSPAAAEVADTSSDMVSEGPDSSATVG